MVPPEAPVLLHDLLHPARRTPEEPAIPEADFNRLVGRLVKVLGDKVIEVLLFYFFLYVTHFSILILQALADLSKCNLY